MLEHTEVPLLSVNVLLWQWVGVIFPRPNATWRLVANVLPVCVINAMQFVYLIQHPGDVNDFILNMFYTLAISDGTIRIFLVLLVRRKFEALVEKITKLYNDVVVGGDRHSLELLEKATWHVKVVSMFNLAAMPVNVICTLCYPLVVRKRAYPFGIALPYVDMMATPVFEFMFVLELPLFFSITILCVPYINMFAAFSVFGTALLRILQHKLSRVRPDTDTDELKACIHIYNIIASYVKDFNDLVTYIVCAEFLIYSVMFSFLLFSINNIQTLMQMLSYATYILTLFYLLIFYYWHANELLLESLNVSQAVIDLPWYSFSRSQRKLVLLFIMQTQNPLMIRVGNVYPMTLATFQSLLNASFSYCTMLRGVTTN